MCPNAATKTQLYEFAPKSLLQDIILRGDRNNVSNAYIQNKQFIYPIHNLHIILSWPKKDYTLPVTILKANRTIYLMSENVPVINSSFWRFRQFIATLEKICDFKVIQTLVKICEEHLKGLETYIMDFI